MRKVVSEQVYDHNDVSRMQSERCVPGPHATACTVCHALNSMHQATTLSLWFHSTPIESLQPHSTQAAACTHCPCHASTYCLAGRRCPSCLIESEFQGQAGGDCGQCGGWSRSSPAAGARCRASSGAPAGQPGQPSSGRGPRFAYHLCSGSCSWLWPV